MNTYGLAGIITILIFVAMMFLIGWISSPDVAMKTTPIALPIAALIAYVSTRRLANKDDED